jgi:AcrR family transcriptional regulator
MAPLTPDPARRSERSKQAILQAAFQLCLERGYEKTTIEAIAEKAAVGKQTIYRWWRSKGAVIMEALNAAVAGRIDFPDSGNITADLRKQMTSVVALLAAPTFGPLYRGVIAAAQSDAELARALAEEIIRPRVAAAVERLERAREQGEIRADADLEAVVELLYGPLYYRYVMQTRPLDPQQVATVLELAFEGLRGKKRVAPRGGRGRQRAKRGVENS